MTTEQSTRVIPAGWYQDPADEAKVRWWNGMTWTEHVESKPAGAVAAAPGALAIEGGAAGISAEQRAAEQRDLEHQYGLSSETDVMSRRTSLDLDARGPSTGTIPIVGVAAPRKAAPARTGTSPAWLLAFIPLFANLLAIVAGYVYFYVTPTPLVAGVAVVLLVLGVLWAFADGRALKERGFTAPSALWALALPVLGPLLYLIARRRRIDGSTPLIVFAAVFILAIGAPLALGLTGGAQVVAKALEVQQAVRADLVGTDDITSVTCPPILESTEVGSVFTCDALRADGSSVHVWVSFDTEDGQFSWALAKR